VDCKGKVLTIAVLLDATPRFPCSGIDMALATRYTEIAGSSKELECYQQQVNGAEAITH
jgi:hypothetical protein